MVSMKLLRQSNLQQEYAHSMVISLLRGLAAVEVAAAHLRAHAFPGYATVAEPTLWFQTLAFVTGFAHQAVVVFFILSGWLVGGSLLNKAGQERAIKHYAIDRLTRLWIVLIPTFVLIIAAALIMGKLDPQVGSLAPGNEYSVATFLGNLFGLQTLLVPVFGSNFPLWSLTNETWYYVLFPLLVVMCTPRSMRARVAGFAGAALIAWFLNGPILLYFSLWLMGAAGSRIRVDTHAAIRWLLFALLAAISVHGRMRGETDDLDAESFIQDFIFSVAFVLWLCSLQYELPPAARFVVNLRQAGNFFAAFSFTLYVLHVPLIGLAAYLTPRLGVGSLSPDSAAHLAIYGAALGAIIVASYLFHLPFEANTGRVRGALKRRLFIGGKQRCDGKTCPDAMRPAAK